MLGRDELQKRFASWRDGHAGIVRLADGAPVLAEVTPLADDLAAMGAIGLDAIACLSRGIVPDAAWRDARIATLAGGAAQGRARVSVRARPARARGRARSCSSAIDEARARRRSTTSSDRRLADAARRGRADRRQRQPRAQPPRVRLGTATPSSPYDWAVRFETAGARACCRAGEHEPLVELRGARARRAARRSRRRITYLPLLYVIGTRQPDDAVDVPGGGRRLAHRRCDEHDRSRAGDGSAAASARTASAASRSIPTIAAATRSSSAPARPTQPNNSGAGTGLYRSTDGGDHWTRISTMIVDPGRVAGADRLHVDARHQHGRRRARQFADDLRRDDDARCWA